MSGEPENISATSGAREHQERAVEWIVKRRIAERWNAKDQAELDAWLDASLANLLAYWRAEDGWNRTELLGVLRPFRPERAVETQHKRLWPTGGRRIAAAAILAMIGAVATAYLMGPTEQVYATPLGIHKKIVLADGSQVELNTDTVLHARMTGGERIVTLDKGEAYFQIRHDGSRPFSVAVAGHRVVDLGTKFLVRREINHVEVALFEGRARFESVDARIQTKSAVLTPGDFVIATINSVSIKKRSPQDLANELPWRHGELIFHFTSLADAATEFNRYNQRKLVVSDPDVARLQIGGTFGTHDVDLFGRAARDLLGVHISNRGEEVVISR